MKDVAKFKVGDKVKVVRKIHEPGFAFWVDPMNETLGQVSNVMDINSYLECTVVTLDNGWCYVSDCLEPVCCIKDTEEQLSPNKYMREIKPGVWADVYDVLHAWEVTDPCLQHLLKKALAGGQRGHKDLEEDLRDILASAKRAVEMYEEWHQK